MESIIIDKPTLYRLSEIYSDVAQRILNVYELMYEKHGLTMRCTDGMRSVETQEKLYAQGRGSPGEIITNAMPGYTLHNYGLAVDSCFVGHDPYLEKDPDGESLWTAFGQFCELEGLEWGGNYVLKDKPHAQKAYGMHISFMKRHYNESGIAGLWKELDLIIKSDPGIFIN